MRYIGKNHRYIIKNHRYIAKYRRFLGIHPEILSDRYFSMKYRVDTLRHMIFRWYIVEISRHFPPCRGGNYKRVRCRKFSLTWPSGNLRRGTASSLVHCSKRNGCGEIPLGEQKFLWKLRVGGALLVSRRLVKRVPCPIQTRKENWRSLLAPLIMTALQVGK